MYHGFLLLNILLCYRFLLLAMFLFHVTSYLLGLMVVIVFHCKQHRMVWPQTKVFLCLWHIYRAWLKQAYIKIKDVATCTTALKSLGEIMYNTNCPNDQDMDAWVKCEVERMANKLLATKAFWMCVKYKWLLKTVLWVVGNRDLPYVPLDTNAAIENYHGNLKTTLHSSKGKFHKK